MRTAEDLRLAMDILWFRYSRIRKHRVFAQRAFAKKAATFTHAHGSFGLHMAKRAEPSDAEQR